jgi:hypothetical protein
MSSCLRTSEKEECRQAATDGGDSDHNALLVRHRQSIRCAAFQGSGAGHGSKLSGRTANHPLTAPSVRPRTM